MFNLLITTATVLSFFVLPSLASFSQGAINPSRDYLIHYDSTTYSSTKSFCTTFRSKCVQFNAAINHHHQLDCVFDQPGPNVRAFCGGIQKNLAGGFTSGETVSAYTSLMIHLVPGASIISGPTTTATTSKPSTSVSAKVHHPKSSPTTTPTTSHHSKSTPTTTTQGHHSTPTHHKKHKHHPTGIFNWPWWWNRDSVQSSNKEQSLVEVGEVPSTQVKREVVDEKMLGKRRQSSEE